MSTALAKFCRVGVLQLDKELGNASCALASTGHAAPRGYELWRTVVKVRDRIEVIADLFLGALYADKDFEEIERRALRSLLCDLMLRSQLPAELERRIDSFAPERFDLRAAAQEFARDPPMCKRRLLELTAALCGADGEFDLAEDVYIEQLARALGMEPTEYEDILLDYEVQELDTTLA